MALTVDPDGSPAPAAPRLGTLPAGPVRGRRYLGTWRRKLWAGAIIGVAVGFLLYQGLTNATEYFLTTNQAVAQKAQLGTKQFRIEGTVENDVRQYDSATHFSIYADGVAVAVDTTADPPQLFKPGIPVVLEGHWDGSYFSSDLIMVKHSNSYTEAHPDRLKSQLPATTVPRSAGT